MGNSVALTGSCCCASRIAASDERQKVVQVVKTDGKILEFKASILVRELLLKFPGLSVGVQSSNNRLQESLPPSCEMQLGNVYFLFPSSVIGVGPVLKEEQPCAAAAAANTSVIVKTIKLVITKKQLQDLASKKISLDSVVSSKLIDASGRESCNMDCGARGWKPRLESIPEGHEFVLSSANYS